MRARLRGSPLSICGTMGSRFITAAVNSVDCAIELCSGACPTEIPAVLGSQRRVGRDLREQKERSIYG
jgi:hypothetical protein